MRDERWRLPTTVLPDGDERPLWVDEGRLTADPIDGAATLPGKFSLPGLVDAHAHLAVAHGAPADLPTAVAALRTMRDQGVLLIRDVGAPRSITLDLRPAPEDPALLVAGRFHAPRGRYYAPFHEPVAPEELVASALAEVARGATWIKIIADWRSPELNYESAVLRELVTAVHAAGARVAAHTQWEVVREVVAAGVDSIEHGLRLDRQSLATMASTGVGWTPTLTALNGTPPAGTPPERLEFLRQARDEMRRIVPMGASLGVTILAGTDTYGTVVDEIRWLIDYGLSPTEALRSATTTARAVLGWPALDAGAPADVLTFDADPRDDPDVLGAPVAILLRGRRIR